MCGCGSTYRRPPRTTPRQAPVVNTQQEPAQTSPATTPPVPQVRIRQQGYKPRSFRR